jgi:predicted PurR-regulated permease PerM
LYIAKGIILPIVFATIIAIVLQPIVTFFVRKRINRSVSIVISLIITFIIIAAFCALLYSQAIRFSESWPLLFEKFTVVINQLITKASTYFNIDPQNIHEWIARTESDFISTSGSIIGKTLTTVGSGMVILIITPIYIFLILYYQSLLLEFIHRLFGNKNKSQVSEIITQIKTVIQHYLKGLILEFIFIAILYSFSLLMLGIDYAILLGIIGALLNVIPYLGAMTAAMLSMMVALVTKSTAWYSVYILACYYVIHLVDYNIIIPKIVASKVKINALISIIGIIAANAMLGIAGMIIYIPALGIIKLIFDHIEPLKPWGFLLGDAMPLSIKNKTNGTKEKKE